MQANFGKSQINPSKSATASLLTRWITVALATGALCPPLALAQSGKLGSYTGTIQVSGTEVSPQVTFRATVKVSLPITERDNSSITADFITEDAPNASVQIAQWDSSFTEKSAGSDGKFSHWSWALAAPIEIAMKPTGILNVDLKKRRHELSLTLLSTQDVAFNCVHSHSGAYKRKQGTEHDTRTHTRSGQPAPGVVCIHRSQLRANPPKQAADGVEMGQIHRIHRDRSGVGTGSAGAFPLGLGHT
jgi:hypothetical protein